jgi:hypothetical protein
MEFIVLWIIGEFHSGIIMEMLTIFGPFKIKKVRQNDLGQNN